MRYLKRKIYALLIAIAWLSMMYCALMIASHYVPGLPRSDLPLGTLVSVMYWIVPVLFILIVFWYFAPSPPPGTGKKLTRRQKKMISQALKEQKASQSES